MTLAMASYALNDACTKALGGTVPVGQFLVLRGCLTIAVIGAWMWWTGAVSLRLPAGEETRVGLRTLGEVCAALCFVTALYTLPLATATAILQVLPLTVALAAAVFLGEALGRRGLLAILIGFAGVLLILRPDGAGLGWPALSALGAVAAITLRDVATRAMRVRMPVARVSFFAAVGVTAAGAAMAPFETWAPIGGREAALIAASALFILSAYVLSIRVMQIASAAATAPFRYTGLLWALLLGLLVFGEWPAPVEWLGGALVLAGGALALRPERRVVAP